MPDSSGDELRDFMAFLDASPTPYHAAREVAKRLETGGFVRLDEREPWTIAAGTRGYVVRGGTLLAFVAGTEAPWDAGFVALGAHTDSPNLRLKPSPEVANHGYRQVGVEVYGGVLLTTWLDRELSLAGRVILAGGRQELVRLPGAPFRIPNLAIHLNREVNKDGLTLNPQTQLVPIWGLEKEGAGGLLERVAAALAQTASRGATAADIVGFDLCLFDAQGASTSGVHGEFVVSARLDNLGSCFPAVASLLGAGAPGPATRVIALFDHEEVGSQSVVGARSRFFESALERITLGYEKPPHDAVARAVARSLFVSSDMAHAVHPNYPDKHDKQHRPVLGGGPVIKVNANQSYATDAVGQGAFAEACRAEGVAPQFFVSRNDQPCGSTIGPITAARVGVRTIDVGNPMLAMHSCRETAGSADGAVLTRVFTRLLREPPVGDVSL
ncbi:MAG TPA: M18 family aminopeptidase [Polyangiaceae bacterium]